MERTYEPTVAVKSAFILVLVSGAIAALNLPIVSVNGTQASDQTYLGRLDEIVSCSVTRVGFPWTFYESNTCSRVTVAEHSVVAGLGDLVVALGVFAIVMGWLHCRYGYFKHPVSRWPVSRWPGRWVSGVSLSAIALLGVATISFTSAALQYRGEQQAIASLGSNIRFVRGVSMPENLSRRVPTQLQWPWQHAENVALRDFDHAALSALSELTNVGVLHLVDGQIDDQTADRIARLSMLRMLDLQDLDLSSLTSEGIAKWSSLTSLRVSHCEMSESMARALATLPNLRELQVTDAPHVIERVAQQVANSSIQKLTLNASLRGAYSGSKTNSDGEYDVRVSIHSAHQLRALAVTAPRSARVELSLNDLPQLSTLGLSNLNVIDLVAGKLPRWQGIDSVFGISQQYTEDDETFISPLLESVKLTDCHSLTGLRLHSRYINSVEISGAPNMHRISLDRWNPEFRVRKQSHQEIETEPNRLTRLVHQLADVEPLRELELLNLTLSDVDMSPLAKLRHLTTLDLTGCQIDSNQVLELLSIEKLDSLTLVRTGTRQEVIDALLCGSEHWKKLLINGSAFDQLNVVNQPQLTSFFSQNFFRARRVSLLNIPRVQGELWLTQNIESLRIENAPKLQGLIVAGDLPAGTRVSGLEELTEFEAGGPGVTDEVLASVSQCLDLRKLVLRSGHISRESLPLITALNKLDTLHLPGMPVDDDLMNRWTSLRFLRDVVLDRTEIGPQSIEQLATLENLQRLSISHTRLIPEDLRPLGSLRGIIRLDIAGVGILPETLAEIARGGFLYQLDISDVKISEELLQVLASRNLHNLAVLKLRGSGLTDAQIQMLAAANPNLVFDIPRREFGDQVYDSLSYKERVLFGRSIAGQYARSGAAFDVLVDSPYSGSSTFDQAWIMRVQELRGDTLH